MDKQIARKIVDIAIVSTLDKTAIFAKRCVVLPLTEASLCQKVTAAILCGT
jgi:hypothetical protein